MKFINNKNIGFEKSSYFFMFLFIIAFVGFWPTYFSNFFKSTFNLSHYMHFHAAMASLWICLLIIQPILIHNRKYFLHKITGKLSYFLAPLFYLSVVLMAHSSLNGVNETMVWHKLWIPLKDLIIFGTAYLIAIKYRSNSAIHARSMIVTGIVFIEPSLVRFIGYMFFPANSSMAYWITIIIIYLVLFFMILNERNKENGRWIFPLTVILYLFFHMVFIFQIEIGFWIHFSKWFATLQLT